LIIFRFFLSDKIPVSFPTQLCEKFPSSIEKQLTWTETIPLPSLKGLIGFSVFPELKKTHLEFYPFLIHIDSVELSEDSEENGCIEVEKSFRGTTLEELYLYLKEKRIRLPIRV
jgi:hypothetical protein